MGCKVGSKSAGGNPVFERGASSLADAYDENRDALKYYFLGRLRCSETAEDLMQEIWIRANQREDALPAITNPRAYLFSTAANLVTDYLRTQSRRDRLLNDTQSYLWKDVDTLTPERYVIARDELNHMGQSLADLRPISRKIFYLNRFGGYTIKQIAEEIGVSTGAVSYHIKLVLDQLACARDDFPGA